MKVGLKLLDITPYSLVLVYLYSMDIYQWTRSHTWYCINAYFL